MVEPDEYEVLLERTIALKAEVNALGPVERVEVRRAVFDRLRLGHDITPPPEELRSLMNRVLDVLDLSSLSTDQSKGLESAFFEP